MLAPLSAGRCLEDSITCAWRTKCISSVPLPFQPGARIGIFWPASAPRPLRSNAPDSRPPQMGTGNSPEPSTDSRNERSAISPDCSPAGSRPEG